MPPSPSGRFADPPAGATLVGQENLLAEVAAAAAQCLRGEVTVVTLMGPAGIGKSRLAKEIAQRLSGTPQGFAWIYLATSRSGQGSHGLVGRLLRHRLRITDGMPPELARVQLEQEVSSIWGHPDVGDVCHFLGQLADVPVAASSFADAVASNPGEANLVRRTILRHFLEADAAKAAIAIILEDVHALDADSYELVRYLVGTAQGRILFLVTARPDLLVREPVWAGVLGSRHRLLEIPPLSEGDATLLMERWLSPCVGGPPEPLVEACVAMAKGNPGLLEHMVRILLDAGVLEETTPEPGRLLAFRVHMDRLAGVRLPMSVDDVVASRVAALSVEDRRVLEHAASMGNVFRLEGLVALDRVDRMAPEVWSPEQRRDADTIRSILLDLERRDYVLALPGTNGSDDAEYVFQQPLEREKIASLISHSRASLYHRVLAEWMSLQDGVDSIEEVAGTLARHLEKAGSRVRAGVAYLRAADLARNDYTFRKACDYYGKGLELIGDDYAASRRVDALHNYGDVLWGLGQTDEALAAFREMLGCAFRHGRLGKGGAAHNRMGRLFRETGLLAEARRHLEAGRALFEAVGDQRGIASSHDDMGQLLWITGEYDQALEQLNRGLAMREKLGDKRSIALSLDNIGLVFMDHGDGRKARESFDSALALRREIGDRTGTAESLTHLGCLAQDRNDWSRALHLFEEAYRLVQDIGERNHLAELLTFIGATHYHLGNADRAVQVLEQAENLCDELGDRLHLAEALRALSKAFLLQGDLGRARESIKRSVDLFGQVRAKPHLAIALRTLAEVTAAGAWGQGHEDRVVDYFMRSIVISKEIGNELEVARSYRAFATFVTQSGHYRDNPAILREAETLDEMAEGIFERHRVELESNQWATEAPISALEPTTHPE